MPVCEEGIEVKSVCRFGLLQETAATVTSAAARNTLAGIKVSYVFYKISGIEDLLSNPSGITKIFLSESLLLLQPIALKNILINSFKKPLVQRRRYKCAVVSFAVQNFFIKKIAIGCKIQKYPLLCRQLLVKHLSLQFVK
jgi:hypothetical protein